MSEKVNLIQLLSRECFLHILLSGPVAWAVFMFLVLCVFVCVFLCVWGGVSVYFSVSGGVGG